MKHETQSRRRGLHDEINVTMWPNRSPLRLASILVAALAMTNTGCLKKSALFCDENTPCTDPELPFCDLTGEFPASEGIGKTCIPNPFPDAGVNDAGMSDANPLAPPLVNGQFADLVLGQSGFDGDLGTGNPAADFAGSIPATDGVRFWVSDSARAMQWDSLPSSNGQAADLVVGQDDFLGNELAVTDARFSVGSRQIAGDGVRFYSCDDNRVLIWDPNPTTDGAAAFLVLGQTNFTSQVQSAGQAGLNNARGVWSDGQRMAVVDQNNNRVVLWDTLPTQNGQPADRVLGQADFGLTDRADPPTRSSMWVPSAVVFGTNRLFVADTFNNRVMVWNGWPTANGQPADVILGQPDGESADFRPTSEATFSLPGGLAVARESLFVADNSNHRVLVFSPIPAVDGGDATAVVGQDNFTDSTQPPGPSQNRFRTNAIAVTDTALYVGDDLHGRVLRFTFQN